MSELLNFTSLVEKNQCTVVDSSLESTGYGPFGNISQKEAILPNAGSTRFGDINIEESSNIHFGQRYENCSIQYIHYLKDLSGTTTYPKDFGNSEHGNPYYRNKISIDRASTSTKHKLKNFRIGKKICLITITVGVIFVIVISSVLLALNINQNVSFSTINPSQSTLPSTTDSTSTTTESWGDLPIVTRKQWNKTIFEYDRILLKNPKYVIICHSLFDKVCLRKRSCIARVNQLLMIDQDCELDDIRYNFLVGGDGNVYEGRGWNVAGEHTEGYNNKSLGIAFVGQFDDQSPTSEQVEAVKVLLEFAVQNNKIQKDYLLFGQYQFDPSTSSPGKNVRTIIESWEHWVAFERNYINNKIMLFNNNYNVRDQRYKC